MNRTVFFTILNFSLTIQVLFSAVTLSAEDEAVASSSTPVVSWQGPPMSAGRVVHTFSTCPLHSCPHSCCILTLFSFGESEWWIGGGIRISWFRISRVPPLLTLLASSSLSTSMSKQSWQQGWRSLFQYLPFQENNRNKVTLLLLHPPCLPSSKIGWVVAYWN